MPAPRTAPRFLWIVIGMMAIAAIAWFAERRLSQPSIPERFARELPASCQQVVLVRTGSETAVPGSLWLLERGSADERWHSVAGPIPVSIGRSGLAWGVGEHHAEAPVGFRVKKEGDGCSPAGIFRLPFAFGYADTAPDLKIKYVPVTSTLTGVDDVKSTFYNQVVDAATVAVDWEGHETMRREDGLYRWGAFVAHNPANVPGGGSCIFLHLWRGPGRPTAGCTAMAEADLVRVLQWLDPAKEPRLVQGLAAW